MSIEDDVALLERVPTLRLLGRDALRVLAISADQREFGRGEVLFEAGEIADSGYVVQRGSFQVTPDDGSSHETVAKAGTLIGELAMIVEMKRPSTAVALEYSSVIRINRNLFQRVLDSDPPAARRLRDELATRASQIASDILMVAGKLNG
jgi:CRP-like cAMP-binding protein